MEKPNWAYEGGSKAWTALDCLNLALYDMAQPVVDLVGFQLAIFNVDNYVWFAMASFSMVVSVASDGWMAL